MFCKYCGASIEGDSSVCPSCSRKGGRVDSGVGFWDMFSAPEDSSVAAPFVEKSAKSTAESAFESPDRARRDALELRLEMLENKPEPKLPKSSPLPFLLCMILCIALCAASFLIISSRTNKELRNLESRVLQLQDRVMAAERAMEEYHTAGYGPASPTIEAPAQAPVTELPAPIPEESPIEVMNVPSDETRALGYESQPGYYLFRYIVKGPVSSFSWEKQQPNGSWTALEFDENGLCERMGLRLVEDLETGSSCIAAAGLTLESAGSYRCVVIDLEGKQLSAQVKLSLGDKAETDSFEPQEKDDDNAGSLFGAGDIEEAPVPEKSADENGDE